MSRSVGYFFRYRLWPNGQAPRVLMFKRRLARHYWFTEEELEITSNYDIKYRMGRDTEGGNE